MKRINTTQRSPGVRIAVLLFLLSSCTSGEQEEWKGRPLEITAEIAAPVTRADAHESNYDKQTFIEGDQINIYSGAYANGSPTVYTYDDLKWLPAGGGDGITMTTDNGTYTASYPTTFSGIKADQTTPTAFWESNQLTSSEIPAKGNRVNFVFAPAAAKITVNVEYSAVTTGSRITLEGDKLQTDSGTGETITLLPVTDSGTNHTYIGIVRANTSATYKITVYTTTDASTGKYHEVAGFKLEAAHNYIYNFTSTNKLILNSVNVTSFGDAVSGGDLNAT